MYNVKCSGNERDVRNCKYDTEPHGNCTGLVNVNCGELVNVRENRRGNQVKR